MKTNLITLALFIFSMTNGSAQISVNSSGDSPHPSAMLEVTSTDKGMLVPRVTNTADVSIPAGGLAEGLLVYQTDSPKGFYYFDGSQWQAIGGSGGSGDDLGNHTATQPIRLVNLTTAERDALSPAPGMIIYNSDVGLKQYYQVQAEQVSFENTESNHTETGCASIAQSISSVSSTSITEVYANINFGENVGLVTVTVYDGEGIGGMSLGSETFDLSNVSNNEFIFSTPIPIECCGDITIEITQAGNSNMSAVIERNIDECAITGNVTSGFFYKNGVKLDSDQTVDVTCSTLPFRGDYYDLEFRVKTQRMLWTNG